MPTNGAPDQASGLSGLMYAVEGRYDPITARLVHLPTITTVKLHFSQATSGFNGPTLLSSFLSISLINDYPTKGYG